MDDIEHIGVVLLAQPPYFVRIEPHVAVDRVVVNGRAGRAHREHFVAAVVVGRQHGQVRIRRAQLLEEVVDRIAGAIEAQGARGVEGKRAGDASGRLEEVRRRESLIGRHKHDYALHRFNAGMI